VWVKAENKSKIMQPGSKQNLFFTIAETGGIDPILLPSLHNRYKFLGTGMLNLLYERHPSSNNL
jgi:hypothetical protein